MNVKKIKEFIENEIVPELVEGDPQIEFIDNESWGNSFRLLLNGVKTMNFDLNLAEESLKFSFSEGVQALEPMKIKQLFKTNFPNLRVVLSH